MLARPHLRPKALAVRFAALSTTCCLSPDPNLEKDSRNMQAM